MNISNLLDEVDYIDFLGNKNIIIKNITYDSRKVKKHCVFVAIKGFTEDGHKYIDSAIQRGASLIICEFLPKGINDKCNYLIVKDSRKAMAKIASIIFEQPSSKMKMIGITGTNGKTSISNLIKGVFEYNNHKVSSIGTLGVVIDKEHYKTDHTTPESSDLQFLFNKMVKKQIEVCSMEVSSHATELKRVDNIDFNIAIFTNLTRDHLDFHENMENYYLAKKKLFYMSNSINIINIDDKYGQRLFNELDNDNKKVYSYSIDKDADIKASNLVTSIEGTSFDLTINNQNIKICVKTPGIFSVQNTLATIGACYNLGLNMEQIADALKEFVGVNGRFELLETDINRTIILDFAHTPDGLEKIMQTVDSFATGRKIVLFGAGGDRDVSRRAPMGEIAGKYCDLTILTSDNPRFEDPYSICEEIAEGVKKYSNNYKIIVERDEAIYYAIKNSKAEDIVVLAGKSTEPYQDLGNEKVPYDEKTITYRMIKRIKEELSI